MHQNYVAGEKVFVEYCGPTVPIVEARTDEYLSAQILVAVSGASNYTYACTSLSQKESDLIYSHCQAAEFFDGWATLTVPNNFKSAVTMTHRYVPLLNVSYEQWSDRYMTAIIPVRLNRPYADS